MNKFFPKKYIITVVIFLMIPFVSLASSTVEFGTEVTGDVCLDGVDNDSDGLIDYPNDPGCDSSSDSDETDVEEEAESQSSGGGIVPPRAGSGGIDFSTDFPVPTEEEPNTILEAIEDFLNINQEESEEEIVEITSNENTIEQNEDSIVFTLPVTPGSPPPFFEGIVPGFENINVPGNVALFSVSVDASNDTKEERAGQSKVYLALILSFIGILLASRFVLLEFSEREIKKEILSPRPGKVIYSIASILLLGSVIFIINLNFNTNHVFSSSGGQIPVDIIIFTDKPLSQELLFDHTFKERVKSLSLNYKKLVTVDTSFIKDTELIEIPEDAVNGRYVIQTSVKSGPYNQFISEETIVLSKYSHNEKMSFVFFVIFISFMLIIGERVFCNKMCKKQNI